MKPEAALNIGKILDETAQRDAVHIAIAPVIAAEKLIPSRHVGLLADGRASCAVQPIGIVDPYLPYAVEPGQRFYLFLYPGTVTSMRHEWTHPAFSPQPSADISASEKWLRDFAEEIGISYSALIAAAESFVASEDCYWMPSDIPDAVYTKRKEMWHHLEIAAGIKARDNEDTFFWCSC
jgi:hypothetical protein